jgi:predicted ATPase with chaperone activity
MKNFVPDFSDIKGLHPQVLDTAHAAMNGERILMVTHGFGAVMIASRLNGLLNAMSGIQMAMVAENFRRADMHAPKGRPFRAPHCSTSRAGMLGSNGRPGEVHLARHGTLYLDHVLDFRRHVIQDIGRNIDSSTLLVASTPACPCFNGFRAKACRCGERVQASFERQKERVINDLGITKVVDIPFRSQSERMKAAPNPDTKTIIGMVQSTGETPTTVV